MGNMETFGEERSQAVWEWELVATVQKYKRQISLAVISAIQSSNHFRTRIT